LAPEFLAGYAGQAADISLNLRGPRASSAAGSQRSENTPHKKNWSTLLNDPDANRLSGAALLDNRTLPMAHVDQAGGRSWDITPAQGTPSVDANAGSVCALFW
jgi:outer membrane protein TolC